MNGINEQKERVEKAVFESLDKLYENQDVLCPLESLPYLRQYHEERMFEKDKKEFTKD
jgi:hypothetical protein